MNYKTTEHHNEATASFFTCLEDSLKKLSTGGKIVIQGRIPQERGDPDFVITPAFLNFDAFLINSKTKKKLWIKVAVQVNSNHGNAIERMYKYFPWYNYLVERGTKFSLVTLYQDEEVEVSLNHTRLLDSLKEMDRSFGTSFGEDNLILYASNKEKDMLEYCVNVHQYLDVPYKLPEEKHIW